VQILLTSTWTIPVDRCQLFTVFFCIALATLKPQAGIMAPVGGPAVPAQPVLYSLF